MRRRRVDGLAAASWSSRTNGYGWIDWIPASRNCGGIYGKDGSEVVAVGGGFW